MATTIQDLTTLCKICLLRFKRCSKSDGEFVNDWPHHTSFHSLYESAINLRCAIYFEMLWLGLGLIDLGKEEAEREEGVSMSVELRFFSSVAAIMDRGDNFLIQIHWGENMIARSLTKEKGKNVTIRLAKGSFK